MASSSPHLPAINACVKFTIIQKLINQLTLNQYNNQYRATSIDKFEIIRTATHLFHHYLYSSQYLNSKLIPSTSYSSAPYYPVEPHVNIPQYPLVHNCSISTHNSTPISPTLSSTHSKTSITNIKSDSNHKNNNNSDSVGAAASSSLSFQCPVCDRPHNSASALKMHLRTHNPPCLCPHCGKAFSRMWLLSGHLRTHTGERPYVCSKCHRAFADRSNLRAHQQTHTTRKRYQCQLCTRSFSRQSLLRKHIMSHSRS